MPQCTRNKHNIAALPMQCCREPNAEGMDGQCRSKSCNSLPMLKPALSLASGQTMPRDSSRKQLSIIYLSSRLTVLLKSLQQQTQLRYHMYYPRSSALPTLNLQRSRGRVVVRHVQ